MQPFFSIIIPVYNAAPYLNECLDSVLQQTFLDWECICIDDGSNDGSNKILEAYAIKDGRFKIVTQVNSGVVVARKNGFVVSSGYYILFLDGDDTLESRALAIIANNLKEGSVDILQFGFRYLKNGSVIAVRRPEYKGAREVVQLIAGLNYSPTEILGMCLWDKCYKREIAEKAFALVGNVRIEHSEDGLFALASFWNSRIISFIHEVLYDYRIIDKSLSHGYRASVVKDKELFIAVAIKLAEGAGRSKEDISREYSYHARLAIGYIFCKSLSNAVSNKEAYDVIKEMSSSKFFLLEKSDWNLFRRRVMRLFVSNPKMFIVFRSLLRFIKTLINRTEYQ